MPPYTVAMPAWFASVSSVTMLLPVEFKRRISTFVTSVKSESINASAAVNTMVSVSLPPLTTALARSSFEEKKIVSFPAPPRTDAAVPLTEMSSFPALPIKVSLFPPPTIESSLEPPTR